MGRKIIYGLLIVTVLGSVGCETLPKKFIRKKKAPAHVASVVYLDEGSYEKRFSNEYYYKNHYTLWKTWHDDVLKNLTGNSKKLRRASEEAYSHLEQMGNYLKPERQAQLKPMVDTLNSYRQKFDRGAFVPSDAGNARSELEKVKRLVANDFYFDKVKEDVLPDKVDLGA
jgi:hypothetical protein